MGVPISPTTAFWVAASVVRSGRAEGRELRRSLLILATLAQRSDQVGALARTLLRLYRPEPPITARI